MNQVVRKSNMTTLIVSKDREFRVRAVNFLNNIAFQSEKFSVASFPEAIEMLSSNHTLLNVVVDGSLVASKKDWELMESLSSKDHIMILVYAKDAVYQNYKTSKPNIFVRPIPFIKAHFVEAFHQRIEQQSGAKSQNPILTKDQVSTQPPQQKSQTVEEATKHLLETIEKINILSKNPSDISSLLTVGQKFNGIIGAFAFLQSKVGMKELKNLAVIIDSVAKTYEAKKDSLSIDKNHHDLVLQSAKCAYKILIQLRDSPSTITADLIQEENKLFHIYEEDSLLYKRHDQSQKNIDELLENIA